MERHVSLGKHLDFMDDWSLTPRLFIDEVSQEEDDETILINDERFVSTSESRCGQFLTNRINGVHDIISQFEQSCFCRMELSICRLKG